MPVIKRIKSLFKKKAIVLAYHRIARAEYDPWGICVNEEHFEDQVSSLKKNFAVIPVEELIEQVNKRSIVHNCVCVTFDDGYTDNFLQARPILEKYQCPATFFIATNYIGTGRLFWWDQMEEIILGSPVLPSAISIKINGNDFDYTITDVVLTPTQLALQKKWEYPKEAPNGRCKFYLALWEQLLPLEYDEIRKVVAQLVEWSGNETVGVPAKLPMTIDQLRSLSESSLFRLGIHTCSHPALPFHSKEKQVSEIQNCKAFLANNFGNTVNAIAFPYGRYNEHTLEVLKETGITAGFTTIGKSTHNKADILSLGRMHVSNWNGAKLSEKINYWFKYS